MDHVLTRQGYSRCTNCTFTWIHTRFMTGVSCVIRAWKLEDIILHFNHNPNFRFGDLFPENEFDVNVDISCLMVVMCGFSWKSFECVWHVRQCPRWRPHGLTRVVWTCVATQAVISALIDHTGCNKWSDWPYRLKQCVGWLYRLLKVLWLTIQTETMCWVAIQAVISDLIDHGCWNNVLSGHSGCNKCMLWVNIQTVGSVLSGHTGWNKVFTVLSGKRCIQLAYRMY
jgi:hypothetical protein